MPGIEITVPTQPEITIAVTDETVELNLVYISADPAFVHNDLNGRSTADAHPQSAVTGLVADLALKAPLASPALTGVPTAPTAVPNTSTTQIATTAFAKAEADAAEAVAIAASDPVGSAAAAQAYAIQRANHTGTQLAATISDFVAAALAATIAAYDPAGSAAAAQAYAVQRANHTGTQLAATISDFGSAALAATAAAYDPAGSAAAAQAASQPLDADLTAIAALTTTAYGRGFLPLADAAAALTYIGAQVAGSYQPSDATLTALAGTVFGANGQVLISTGSDFAWSGASLTYVSSVLAGSGGTAPSARAATEWATAGGVGRWGTQVRCDGTAADSILTAGGAGISGHVAIGAAASVSADYLLTVAENYTGSAAVFRGVRIQSTHSTPAAASASTGLDVIHTTAGTNGMDHIVSGQFRGTAGGTGTLTWAYAVHGNMGVDGRTVTNLAQLYAYNAPVTSGTVAKKYGCFVELQTGGTENWGLYSEDRNNALGKAGVQLNIGQSGTNYPSIGYNVLYGGTGGAWTSRITDRCHMLDFGGSGATAFTFKSSASVAAGGAITWTTLGTWTTSLLTVNTATTLTAALTATSITMAGALSGVTTLTSSGNAAIAQTAASLGVTARLRVDAPNSNTGPALAIVADSVGRGFGLYGAGYVDGVSGSAMVINTTASGAAWYVFTTGNTVAGVLALPQSAVIGTTALVSTERARIAGGTDATTITPGATDFLVGGGGAHLGGNLKIAGTTTVANGSAGAPGLRLASDIHGLYRAGSTTLGISVAGVAALNIGAPSAGFGGGFQIQCPVDGDVGYIYPSRNTSSIDLYGGTSASTGAHVRVYGASHASKASNVEITNGNTARITIDGAGNIVCGSAALATTATDGFLHISSSAGAPTGVPTASTGRVPIHIDTTNIRIYAYIGGAWKYAALI